MLFIFEDYSKYRILVSPINFGFVLLCSILLLYFRLALDTVTDPRDVEAKRRPNLFNRLWLKKSCQYKLGLGIYKVKHLKRTVRIRSCNKRTVDVKLTGSLDMLDIVPMLLRNMLAMLT
jgi:hypothetical protein